MPTIITQTQYLSDLPLYKTEKPYFVFWSNDNDSRPLPTTNIQLENYDGVEIRDIREQEHDFTLEKNGFEILNHQSAVRIPITTGEDIALYQRETEQLLKSRFDADVVCCYEARVRKNDEATLNKPAIDLRDPLVVERPAAGAHVDATINSAPMIIKTHLPEEFHSLIGSGARFRIVNTWRPMVPVVEDKPLAFIDYFSIDKHDLVGVDRVTSFQTGEVYMLKYASHHKWFWLSEMTQNEPALFLTFDSKNTDMAKFCAHTAIENPLAKPGVPYRQSVETRSIVITKE